MCPTIHVVQFVQEASRHSNIVDAEKVLLKQKCKLTLGLSTRGEMVDDEADGTIKVLVLTELSTNCVSYVIVGQETRSVRNQICIRTALAM